RPRQSISVAMEALDHVHVFTVEIAANLIEPRIGIEAPGIDDQRVAFPVSNGFSGICTIEILQGSVLPAITWNHAIHRLRRNQPTLSGINKDEVARRLTNVGRDAGAR